LPLRARALDFLPETPRIGTSRKSEGDAGGYRRRTVRVIDVHKNMVAVCVRVPGPSGERVAELAEFSTFTEDLLALRDWLVAHGVTRVGMEATGVYWKPVFWVLEDATECWLLNARHMRNVPGRKTDRADAEWICRLMEYGLVRASFVPPKEIRELRDLTRFRKTRIEERTREAQRLDKILQDAGVKLSSVASDVLGKSGRDMLTALVAGSRDPAMLAELARGQLRRKLPQLQAALNGRFGSHHGLLVGEVLSLLDYLDESIERLSVEIDRVIAPFLSNGIAWPALPGSTRGWLRRSSARSAWTCPASRPRRTSRRGQECVPASMSRRARRDMAPPARATAGCNAI